MIQGSLARRYARALLASVGDDFERAHADLSAIVGSLRDAPEVMEFFADPTVSRKRKADAVEKLIEAGKPHPLVANFLRVLAARNRLGHLEDIARVFDELVDERLGRVKAEVVSAAPLAADQEARIRETLVRATRREVELSTRVDPSILGGLVAKVGSKVFDGSLRTQLGALRDELLRRG
ncbi:MAG: ATP synthase F1 subunit delta [Pseudomonadota bacterium]